MLSKSQTKPTWPFVEVEWEDATSVSKWTSLDIEKLRPPTVYTRGWLVHDGLDYVVIAATYVVDDNEYTFGELISIPRGCIVNLSSLIVNFQGEVFCPPSTK